MTSPTEFISQTRNEAAKVAWPSRKETMITTAMVFVMVILASLFLFFTDQIIAWVLRLVLGIGG
jgi:preprotein translocase subunit SecE